MLAIHLALREHAAQDRRDNKVVVAQLLIVNDRPPPKYSGVADR